MDNLEPWSFSLLPFPFFSLGWVTESDSNPLTLKGEINDKGALQVCIRDLIGFGLSGLLALPDVGPLCSAMWENLPALEMQRCACRSFLSHLCTISCYCGLLYARARYKHTHILAFVMHLAVFCKRLMLVWMFVCIRLGAQYPSHSLWSLRGSFPPALPPVSVLVRPQGYNDCRTFQICSSGWSDQFAYLESGSHFLS